MTLDISERRLVQELGGRKADQRLASEIVEEIGGGEKKERSEPFGHLEIDHRFNPVGLPTDEMAALRTIEEYLGEFGAEYHEKMVRLIEEYRKTNPKFARLIEDKMKLEGYLFPRLTIYHREDAQSFVDGLGRKTPTKIDDEDFVLAFNFPRPIARFWYKGGRQFGGGIIKDVPKDEIEWGYFYRGMVEVVQEWLHNYHSTHYGLKIERLSLPGDHNKDKYYYVFRIWKKK